MKLAQKKKKKHNLTWWKKKTWDVFSIWVRLRDALETTGTTENLLCFTCKKLYPAFGKGCAQAGHLVPGRSHAVLFEEHGVHGQCYNCNVTLKGNTLIYRREMIKKYGEAETERIERGFFNQTFKYSISDLQELSVNYQKKAKELRNESH